MLLSPLPHLIISPSITLRQGNSRWWQGTNAAEALVEDIRAQFWRLSMAKLATCQLSSTLRMGFRGERTFKWQRDYKGQRTGPIRTWRRRDRMYETENTFRCTKKGRCRVSSARKHSSTPIATFMDFTRCPPAQSWNVLVGTCCIQYSCALHTLCTYFQSIRRCVHFFLHSFTKFHTCIFITFIYLQYWCLRLSAHRHHSRFILLPHHFINVTGFRVQASILQIPPVTKTLVADRFISQFPLPDRFYQPNNGWVLLIIHPAKAILFASRQSFKSCGNRKVSYHRGTCQDNRITRISWCYWSF